MRLRCSPSIRSRLIMLVLACLAPAAFGTVSLIWFDYHRARDQLVSNSVLTARAMAIVLDKEFAIIESSLQALAMSPSLTADDLATFHVQAAAMAHQRGVLNVVLSDGDGRQTLNTLLPFGAALPRENVTAPLKAVSVAQKPGVSDLFVGPVSHRPIFAVGVPIKRQLATDVLSASMSTERLHTLLIQQNLPSDWIAAILDKNGTIVARSHETERYIGKRSRLDASGHMASLNEGSFEGKTLDGTPVFAVFSRAPNSQWAVAIGIPTASLNRALNQQLSWFIGATLTLLAISLVLAWFIGGRIARSVRGLARPAHALGEGREVAFESTNLRETDEVGMAMAKASDMMRKATYRADHDVLTGLANRSLLKRQLDQKLALCERNSTYLSVLYLDLDGFKKINDNHGHAMGDRLLQIVAHRLRVIIRTSDVIARLGGDEFAIVLAGAPAREAGLVAAKLIDSLGAPYKLGEVTVTISASIGLAQYPQSGANGKALLQRADDAMYQAKLDGKARFAFAPD